MAVPKNQVSNWQQAIDYMNGSATSAAGGVCPGATSVYSAYAAAYAMLQGTPFDKSKFLSELAAADSACKGSLDYNPYRPMPTAANPSGTAPVDPSSGGAAPVDITPVTAAIGGGLPWWIWLIGGGAVLYMLFGKKNGKKAEVKKGKKGKKKGKR